MLSPHIKKKVDKLWDRFWSAGLTNPLVAIEQITYLLSSNAWKPSIRRAHAKAKPQSSYRPRRIKSASSILRPANGATSGRKNLTRST